MNKIKENKKTIIHVWTQDFLELDGTKSKEFFGFGDLIRCSIELYKLCKCMNYNFILDISLHPISQFYNEYKHEYSELISENKDKIYWYGLSSNPNPEAIELLRTNPSKIDWIGLSQNPAAIKLLKENHRIIKWDFLSENPAIFDEILE